MTRTSRMPLVSLLAVAVVGFSVSAVTPAHSGPAAARPTVKFMMKNGAKLSVNTQQEAKERLRQLAKDPAVFSDTSDKTVRVYELAPSEKAIVGRRAVSN